MYLELSGAAEEMSSRKELPVAQGGLFSTPKVAFSKETQELLKGMMPFVRRERKQQLFCRYDLHVYCPHSNDAGIKTYQLSAETLR